MKRRNFFGVVIGGLCSVAGMKTAAPAVTAISPRTEYYRGYWHKDERGRITGVTTVHSPRSLAGCDTIEQAILTALQDRGWYQASYRPTVPPVEIPGRMSC